jgi:hypothetical protein
MQLWQLTARILEGQMKPQVKLQAQVIVWLRLDFDYTDATRVRERFSRASFQNLSKL